MEPAQLLGKPRRIRFLGLVWDCVRVEPEVTQISVSYWLPNFALMECHGLVEVRQCFGPRCPLAGHPGALIDGGPRSVSFLNEMDLSPW